MIGIGQATRLLHTEQLHDVKTYRTRVRLGATTATLDNTSPITEEQPWEHVTPELVLAAASKFTGEQLQTPPMYDDLAEGYQQWDELMLA